MELRESTIARLSLLALALVEWTHATNLVWGGLMPLHPFAIALVFALYLTSFALLLLATARREPTAHDVTWSLGPMLLVFVAFAYHDAVRKASTDIYPTSDAHAYMDVAARILLQGKNPYAHSLVDGFRIYQMPLRLSTPLLDGDISDRLAYPSLSFLVLVPLALAHVPTYLAYGLAFVASVLLLVRHAPWWLRGLVFAFFTHDDTFLTLTFGGVTDSVWALCLVAAAVCWNRRVLAAVLVGIACAYKQHAWFFLAYLVVRLCREEGVKPWEGAPRRFLLVIAGIFAAVNLPFFVWDPRAWLLGNLEPLIAPMIQLSEGLTALGMTGYLRIPRPVSTVTFWGLYVYSVAIYARHTAAVRSWCWILPAVALWFQYRALISYWYFNALPLVGALLVPGPALARDDTASGRTSARVGLGLAFALGLTLVGCALRKPPFDAVVLSPLDTWDSHVFRLRVRVTNRTGRVTSPRFAVQTTAVQPMQWVVDIGYPLTPGATGDFVVRAPTPSNNFEIAAGARLAVVDGNDLSSRAFFTIPPESSVQRIDVVPNGAFRYLDTRSMTPYAWTLERSDGAVRVEARSGAESAVALVFDPVKDASPPPDGCYDGQTIAKPDVRSSRFANLLTLIELPLGEITMKVHVPPTANRAPWDELYGLHVAVEGWQGYVLFGADVPSGTLPSGASFVGVPAPRGTWAPVVLSLSKVLADLHAPLETMRFHYLRFPDLDVPATPVQVGLCAQRPTGSAGTVEFGAVISLVDGRNERELVARGLGPGAGRDAWRGGRELENLNVDHARTLLDRAVAVEPTVNRLILLGDVALHANDPIKAKTSYERALALEWRPIAEKGLGWALVSAGDPAGAIPHFDRARAEYGKGGHPPRPFYFDSLVGLMVANAKLGRCDEAKRFAREAAEEDPHLHVELPRECSP